VSPKTLERYDELATRQVAPHLGALKLQKLRPEHVEQWHGPLLKTGLAPRTVGHAHRLLALVLKYAVENGTLARNVAAIRKPPAAEAREVEILTAGQIAEVRTKLAGHTLLAIPKSVFIQRLQWRAVTLRALLRRSLRGCQRQKAKLAQLER
jgi:integrase